MQQAAFYQPQSAMVIVAHPDDIEYSCSGTIARWVKMGTSVCYILCTSGEVGIAQPGMTKTKAAEIREAEQRQAAAVVGVQDVVFLREPDGLLEATLNLRKKLVREIRRFQPEVILCGDPTIVFSSDRYINHPDHRAAGIAALDAVFPAAGQPNLFEELEQEGLAAHKPRKVYITGRHQQDLAVNISETIDLKIAALRAHVSQMINHDPEEYVRQAAALAAKGKEMDYAELFRVITLVDDEQWLILHPETA